MQEGITNGMANTAEIKDIQRIDEAFLAHKFGLQSYKVSSGCLVIVYISVGQKPCLRILLATLLAQW